MLKAQTRKLAAFSGSPECYARLTPPIVRTKKASTITSTRKSERVLKYMLGAFLRPVISLQPAPIIDHERHDSVPYFPSLIQQSLHKTVRSEEHSDNIGMIVSPGVRFCYEI